MSGMMSFFLGSLNLTDQTNLKIILLFWGWSKVIITFKMSTCLTPSQQQIDCLSMDVPYQATTPFIKSDSGAKGYDSKGIFKQSSPKYTATNLMLLGHEIKAFLPTEVIPSMALGVKLSH
jgi:hypothetical protein